MEEKDFTIWHPYVSDDGTYEPKAYSFRERIATLSDPCDLMEFLKASYLTEGFCLKKCEKWNGDFVKNDSDMIEEDYVSFETAKLLKEKGFNGAVSAHYNDIGGMIMGTNPISKNTVKCPTLQMAMKWLRETFEIHCQIDCPIAASNWRYGIRDLNQDEWFALRNMGDYDTYEEACEAAIRYCLENLIEI